MRRSITRAFQHSHVARQALQTTVPVAQRVLQVYDFGSEPVQYDRGLKLQESLAAQRLHADSHDTLLQLQVNSSVDPRVSTDDRIATETQVYTRGALKTSSSSGWLGVNLIVKTSKPKLPPATMLARAK